MTMSVTRNPGFHQTQCTQRNLFVAYNFHAGNASIAVQMCAGIQFAVRMKFTWNSHRNWNKKTFPWART